MISSLFLIKLSSNMQPSEPCRNFLSFPIQTRNAAITIHLRPSSNFTICKCMYLSFKWPDKASTRWLGPKMLNPFRVESSALGGVDLICRRCILYVVSGTTKTEISFMDDLICMVCMCFMCYKNVQWFHETWGDFRGKLSGFNEVPLVMKMECRPLGFLRLWSVGWAQVLVLITDQRYNQHSGDQQQIFIGIFFIDDNLKFLLLVLM